MIRRLELAGAAQSLLKRADTWDNIGYGLTAASFIPGIGNAVMPVSGVYDAARSAMSGDWAGVAGGLAGAGVGLVLAGEGGKAVQYGAKYGLKGLGALAKTHGGLGKGIGAAVKAEGGGARGAWNIAKGMDEQAGRWAQPHAARITGAAHQALSGRAPRMGRAATAMGGLIRKHPALAFLGASFLPGMLLGGGEQAGGAEAGANANRDINRIGVQTQEQEIKNVAPGLSPPTQFGMPMLAQSAQQQQMMPPQVYQGQE